MIIDKLLAEHVSDKTLTPTCGMYAWPGPRYIWFSDSQNIAALHCRSLPARQMIREICHLETLTDSAPLWAVEYWCSHYICLWL